MTVIPVFRSASQIFTFNKIFNSRFDDKWRWQKGVSIKCGRGPWTVDRLKCGLLPVDSTFFLGPHCSFLGHF